MSAGSPFYENGLPRFKGEYQNGKMHGYWEFYKKVGSLMRSGECDQLRQVGIWRTFTRAVRLLKKRPLTKNQE